MTDHSTTDHAVIAHYAPHTGNTARAANNATWEDDPLCAALRDAAQALCSRKELDMDALPPTALSSLDELHTGGAKSTLALLQSLTPDAAMSVLDIGSGLGGPARLAAQEYGCTVRGLDLTPSFCLAARMLSHMTKMDNLTEFDCGDALEMPYEDASFDMAMTIHTAMNIADKQRLYKESARVLKRGALFGIFDVMAPSDTAKDAPAPLHFPVPWAAHSGISHLAPVPQIRAWLEESGFVIESITDKTAMGLDALKHSLIHMDKVPESAIGPRLIMGEDYRLRRENFVKNIEEKRCGVWQIIARKL